MTSNEWWFNTEFIARVELIYVMQASGEQKIILFNKFNKFSNEPSQILHTQNKDRLKFKIIVFY
jgi:hypothetical protein